VEILQAVYERWGRGDFWTPEVFDPEVEVVWGADMPDVGTYRGLAGLEKGVREFFTAWDEVAWAADEILDVGETVLVLATARGRGRGSGLETETKFAHVWTMCDGKATRIVAYTNQAEARAAVGLRE
jgi:ketosteroid isomerase-like protein